MNDLKNALTENPIWSVKVVKLDKNLVKVCAYNYITRTERYIRYVKRKPILEFFGRSFVKKIAKTIDKINFICIILNVLEGFKGEGFLFLKKKKKGVIKK